MTEAQQTKGFYGRTVEDLESQLNNFLLGLDSSRIVSVLYQAGQGKENFQHFGLVVYKRDVAQ